MRDKNLSNYERLQHIQEAIEIIGQLTEDCNKEIFINDLKINNSVLLQFTIIGEAIINVDTEILQRYAYPWHKVRAFRNLIAHEYFVIRLDMVWEIVEKDLPELKKLIDKILKMEFKTNNNNK